MFNSLAPPVVIAHRGASAHAPENTMPAFLTAIDQGAAAIELDVQLTKDGIPVVFHDSTLSRTTDGSGILRQKTLAQVRTLDAGAFFSPAFRKTKIPTLEEVYSQLDPAVYLNIELKNLNAPFDQLPHVVARLTSKYKKGDRALFSSFNPIALYWMGKLLPSSPRGLLLDRSSQVDFCLVFPRVISSFQSIHISLSSLTRDRVAALHRLGKRVYTYTMKHAADIQHALDSGADGFFVDDPLLGYRTITNSGYNAI